MAQNFMPSFFEALRYARRADATKVHFGDFFLENPQAEGHFKFVTYGTFTAGKRKSQIAVGKWLKRAVCDDGNAMIVEIKISKKSLQIIAAFNNANIYHKPIFLNLPEIWKVIRASRSYWKGFEFIYHWTFHWRLSKIQFEYGGLSKLSSL